MRPRLWHRWFLLSAGLVLATLTALLWAQARGFEHGLLDYARAQEQARLPVMAERLAEEYRDAGGWWRLQAQPRRWRQLMRFDGRRDSRPVLRRSPQNAAGPAPIGQLRPGRARVLDFLQRLSLLDANAALLHGPVPGAGARYQAINVDGRMVGRIALTPLPEVYESAALAFATAQRQRAVWIALPLLALAVVTSWALAQRMLRRLDALATASRRLAGGDYAVRLGAQGGDELGELARDFDRMALSLQQSREARDRWIADISHELRTPLTILRGELHALQDGIRPLDQHALASLLSESERLARRIDDLYALALSDTGGMRYQFARVDLSALVERIGNARQSTFDEAGLPIGVTADGSVWLARADAARLEQLLDNLLGNALRYTDPGGQVQVRVTREEGYALLSVDDSAPAVAAEDLSRLLDRHYRAIGGQQRAVGAGLGLAICCNIVEAHGGRIGLAHSALGGLSVRVRLPIEGGAT